MRFPLLLAACAGLASLALADRVITIPMGRKIAYRQVKFEGFTELSRARSLDRFIGVGVTPEIELDYHGERISDGPLRDTLDFSYNLVTSITNQSPGISLGVQDVMNRTRDHRRFYLSTTWRTAVDTIGPGNIPMDVTLGISQGKRTLPMVGVSIPFATNVRLLVEDDGVRIASGIEVRAFGNALGARFIVRDQDVMVGGSLTLRF